MSIRIIPLALLAGSVIAATAPSIYAQETLKIGAIVTLSGAGSGWGQAILYGAELAADDVNAQGGLDVGGKKYKVQIVPYDDKYQANEAVTAANRLVSEDKVQYIMGPVGGAPLLAISPITERNKVLVFTLTFTPRALGSDKPNVFRPVPTTEETSQPQIDWLVKAKHIQKVGALFPNDESGQQISHDLEKSYAHAGVQLSAKEFFERQRVDMVPLLTRVIGAGVDTIDLNGNSPATAGMIVRQARELGFKGNIVRTGGPATAEIVAVTGKDVADGILVNSPLDPGSRAIQDYSARYQKKYGKRMNGFSPAYYDETHMLFRAMQQAGTVTDTTRVKTALEAEKDYQGILGKLSWVGKTRYGIDHQISAPFYISEIKDGQEVVRARCTFEACQ
ncbi:MULTISPECIES: ABC transporter substrate-binding protein [Paraburkholderia]|uniref:Amino acid/amide ABC transporter substrate-binding protein, HAAT family n=1 Tax=Paraburkholderia aspalathi TaxID=1324617 RepID=A0A1I7ERI6_9BURK|nr:ABC transporter substrate-binding protein [Paraburkholderia aspalathi]SFU26503.1 amino acid/amide ABC transporter substrate-binding protein, HAAT family [Paraburkholderia aspalathi]